MVVEATAAEGGTGLEAATAAAAERGLLAQAAKLWSALAAEKKKQNATCFRRPFQFLFLLSILFRAVNRRGQTGSFGHFTAGLFFHCPKNSRIFQAKPQRTGSNSS